MRICYFGGYDREHLRNRVLIQGLRRCGARVLECHTRHRVKLLRPFILAREYMRLHRDVDVVVVGASCHAYVPFAWALARLTRKPLICDAFVSLYEIWTDRTGRSRPRGGAGWLSFLLDKLSATLSDLVLFDTQEHVSYFCDALRVSPKKVRFIPIGADDALFSPKRRLPSVEFTAVFGGTYLPLHGVGTITQAAALLSGESGIRVDLFGDDGLRTEVEKLPPAANLRYRGNLPFREYAEVLMTQTDVALGIFGTTPKAGRVIPCKVYEALASGVPLVTADTLAVRRLLRSNHNCVLVEPGNPRSLADALLALQRDPELRLRLAREGRRTYEQVGTPEALGRMLLSFCQEAAGRP